MFAFCVSLGHFVFLLLFEFVQVILDLVSSVLSQEIGWEERLRNDTICRRRFMTAFRKA